MYVYQAGTEAQVFENVCLAATASPSPLSYLFPYGLCTKATVNHFFRQFTMVKDHSSHPPIWCHNTRSKKLTPNLNPNLNPHLSPFTLTRYRNTYVQRKALLHIYDPIMAADGQKRAGGSAFPAEMRSGDGYKLVPLLTPDGKAEHCQNQTANVHTRQRQSRAWSAWAPPCSPEASPRRRPPKTRGVVATQAAAASPRCTAATWPGRCRRAIGC